MKRMLMLCVVVIMGSLILNPGVIRAEEPIDVSGIWKVTHDGINCIGQKYRLDRTWVINQIGNVLILNAPDGLNDSYSYGVIKDNTIYLKANTFLNPKAKRLVILPDHELSVSEDGRSFTTSYEFAFIRYGGTTCKLSAVSAGVKEDFSKAATMTKENSLTGKWETTRQVIAPVNCGGNRTDKEIVEVIQLGDTVLFNTVAGIRTGKMTDYNGLENLDS